MPYELRMEVCDIVQETGIKTILKKKNRFKGLDLINRVPYELRMEVCDIVQETGIKTILKKKKWKKAK